MSETVTTTPGPRTYGNWRRPVSPGLGSLGTGGTIVLMAGLIVMVIALAFSKVVALGVAVVVAAVLAPLVVKDRYGRNGFSWMAARVCWRKGCAAGQNLYRSGPLARVGHGHCSLPGLGARLEATEARDGIGRPFVVLHHPGAGHVSTVISTSPDGTSLVDQVQIDDWVSQWGAWLAALSAEPGLVGASVTIEAAPDPGTRLRREVEGNLVDGAPPLAASVLRSIMQTYPAGSAALTCRIALTWSTATQPGVARRRSVEEMAVEIGHRLPGLTRGLATTGAGPARPMTMAELAAAVRVAYDPQVYPLVDQVGPGEAGISWEDAGPTAAEEHWDYYRHDGAASVTWAMVEPPRGHCYSSVLERLLAPHGAIARKRVTLLYRPYDPAAATRVVERDRRDALFAANGQKVARSRDLVGLRAAEQTAHEEATGAGVVRFSMLVTATVADPADLPAVTGMVENLGITSRITLRRVYGSQAPAFLAALPLGMVLSSHLRVPQALREAV